MALQPSRRVGSKTRRLSRGSAGSTRTPSWASGVPSRPPRCSSSSVDALRRPRRCCVTTVCSKCCWIRAVPCRGDEEAEEAEPSCAAPAAHVCVWLAHAGKTNRGRNRRRSNSGSPFRYITTIQRVKEANTTCVYIRCAHEIACAQASPSGTRLQASKLLSKPRKNKCSSPECTAVSRTVQNYR